MSESLRSLLAGCIDYAGVFPPAQLPLNTAMQNYLRYVQEPEAWLLNRFVCPIGLMPELSSSVSNWRDVSQCGLGHRVAVIGTTSESTKQFLENIGQTVQVIVDFQKSHGDFIKVDSLELQLPSDLCDPEKDTLRELLDAIRHKVRVAELCPISVFIEIPIGRQHATWLTHLLQAIQAEYDDHIRLKIRTGGVPADLLPGPQELARFVIACASANVAWKATAGLHDVLSRFAAATNTWHFGFLNVLAAAVLATVHNFEYQQIVLILTETEIDQFKFMATDFRWGEYTTSVAQIDLARRHSMLSFGSCSFDEPRDGLRKLLLIP